jgi:hypothetical protein
MVAMTLLGRLKAWWELRGRAYWTAVGVIPRWQLLAVYLLISVVFVVGLNRYGSVASRADAAAHSAKILASRVDAESKARVKESCRISEVRYQDAVTQLGGTYAYLTFLSPDERKSTLNQFILKAVPKQESDLKNLAPAKFCHAKLPPTPKRPSSLEPADFTP